MENVLLSDVDLRQSMFISSALRTLRYTVLMVAPAKVQPMFVSYTLRITRLHCLYSWARHLKYSLCLLALPKESLGYTALMVAPPKLQPKFVSST